MDSASVNRADVLDPADPDRATERTSFDWRTPALGVALALAAWSLAEVHAHAERLARVETAAAGIERTLERIEGKLDRLTETGR